jgi:hypothetical protein
MELLKLGIMVRNRFIRRFHGQPLWVLVKNGLV